MVIGDKKKQFYFVISLTLSPAQFICFQSMGTTACDIFDEYYSTIDEERFPVVVFLPPKEIADADTDQDSDLSDAEATGTTLNLPARLLQSEAETSNSVNSPANSLPEKLNNKNICWVDRKPENQISILPSEQLPESSFEAFNCDSIPDCFMTFYKDLFEHLVTQSNIYATQKNIPFRMTNYSILAFSGALILSGYHKLPQKKLYWEGKSDVTVKLIADNFRTNDFDSTMRILHCANNLEMDDDRMYKVRPLFDIQNAVFKRRKVTPRVNVDEQMLKYYGHHSAKQFIRGKPIRYGFKNWAICLDDDYL